MKKFVLAIAILISAVFVVGCSDKVSESTITNIIQTSQYKESNLGITDYSSPFEVKNLKIDKVLLDTKTDYKAKVTYDLVAKESLDAFKKSLKSSSETPTSKTETTEQDVSSVLHSLKNNLTTEVAVATLNAKYGDFKAGQIVDTLTENVSLKKVNDQWVED